MYLQVSAMNHGVYDRDCTTHRVLLHNTLHPKRRENQQAASGVAKSHYESYSWV
jgi:hypothetical protein